MAVNRPHLSISLPASFQFQYRDGEHPRTPEPQIDDQPTEPPQAPRIRGRPGHVEKSSKPGKYRVKNVKSRRQVSLQQEEDDSVIPSIEMSEADSLHTSPVFLPQSATNDFLSPIQTLPRYATPPKTPISRITAAYDDVEQPAHEWELINDHKGSAFERAPSVCSSFSDSSLSSLGSSDFSASVGGSCTSPESEATDAFDNTSKLFVEKQFGMFVAAEAETSNGKRVKAHRNPKWTPEMRNHLWATYTKYLQDPRVTPFKALAGTPLPLGVCSRVASQAKRTWRGHRLTTPSPLDQMLDSSMSSAREGSPDTIRQGNTTNVSSLDDTTQHRTKWPRSEATTRRELRKMYKRMPDMPAFYKRIAQSRSPSPLLGSSPPSSSSRQYARLRKAESSSSSFSSRDMHISLAEATAPSMQPSGPLAQLWSDLPVAHTTNSSRPEGWFDRIGRSHAHQKSQSLQLGLGLESRSEHHGSLLDSPFDAALNRSALLHSMSTTKSLGRRDGAHRKSASGPSLDSPVELRGPATFHSRSLKRRLKDTKESSSSTRTSVHNLFGPPAASIHSRLRSRGFSTSAMGQNIPLSDLFASSTTLDEEMAEAPEHNVTAAPEAPRNIKKPVPRLGPSFDTMMGGEARDPIPRLGSPFAAEPSRSFNTFPRISVPLSLENTLFQQRLGELAKGAKPS